MHTYLLAYTVCAGDRLIYWSEVWRRKSGVLQCCFAYISFRRQNLEELQIQMELLA
jgi:hypothetical protein